MADIEKELAELRESQERGKTSMEHSVSEASLYLQDQVRLPTSSARGPGPFLGLLPRWGQPHLSPQLLLCVYVHVCVYGGLYLGFSLSLSRIGSGASGSRGARPATRPARPP